MLTLIVSHTTQRILSYLHATSYDDSIWVQQCLLGIGKRFLRSFYGVLTGGTVKSYCECFYRLVNERNVSLTRAAVSGLLLTYSWISSRALSLAGVDFESGTTRS